MNIKEKAKAYESKETKLISELDKVSIDLDIWEEERTDNDGKPFKVNLTKIDDEEYRVPDSVLKQLKALLEDEATKNMKFFKVKKTGSGMNTSYQTINLG